MRTNMDNRGMFSRSCIWLAVFVFQGCFQLSVSMIYWSAYVEIRYFDRGTNTTLGSICECGVFGANSPLESVSGLVVLPNSDPLACSENTTFTDNNQQWIALIKKGNCTYSKKIQAAQREGASAVVIYNIDGTGNDTNLMSHSDADDIVAIMIGNTLGTEIASLINNGTDVYIAIVVANPHGLWFSATWAYALSFTFIGITTITLFYFIFLLIKRMYLNRQLRIQQKEIKKVAKNAIANLQVRTLQRGDPEVESEDITCAVCTDSFKRNEEVTILPCRHLYHKKCIEPWLLEHPTCPMCKFNILISKIEEESSDQPSSSLSDVRFCPARVRVEILETATSADQREISNLEVQTAEEAPGEMSDHTYCELNVHKEHIYENPAFEEETAFDHQDINNQV